MAGAVPLIPEQRQQLLLTMLRDEGGVLSTRSLTDALEVSHMTVRRDIAALEAAGRVVSVQGGVRLADFQRREPPTDRAARGALEVTSKEAIAALAAKEVTDGMVVFLDAGTTCEAVVAHLAGRTGLTVVTSDFHTLDTLVRYRQHYLIHTGGAVDHDRSAANGTLAAATIRSLGIDLYLMSTGTWDLAHGVSVPIADTALLKTAAIEGAARTVLLADSTKFGSFERYRVTPLQRLDAVVTDDGLAPEDRSRLEDAGVALSVAATS